MSCRLRSTGRRRSARWRDRSTRWRARCSPSARELEGFARSQAAMLDGVFERSPLALGFVDREQRFLRVNAALAAMNGVPAEDHVGHTIAEVVPDVDAAARTLMQSVIDSGEPVHGSRCAARRPPPRAASAGSAGPTSPSRTTTGAVRVVGILAQDVTVERHEREREERRIEDERRAALVTAVLEDLNRDLAARAGLAETAAALLHHALDRGQLRRGHGRAVRRAPQGAAHLGLRARGHRRRARLRGRADSRSSSPPRRVPRPWRRRRPPARTASPPSRCEERPASSGRSASGGAGPRHPARRRSTCSSTWRRGPRPCSSARAPTSAST